MRRHLACVRVHAAPFAFSSSSALPRGISVSATSASTPPTESTPHPPATESANPTESGDTLRDTDAFRAGYNMGMLAVQLETLRMKMEDNKEVLKTQMASMRDTLRSNHEIVVRAHNDTRGLVMTQLQENLQKITMSLDHNRQRMEANEEAMKELSRQQYEALQKHTDDRLENIKDTIKAGVLIIVAMLAWLLVLAQQVASTNAHRGGNQQGFQNPTNLNGANAGKPKA